MRLMRTLGPTHRLQALSAEGIADEFELVAIKHAKKLKFQTRKPKPGPLLNALVAYFLGLDEAQQERIFRVGLERLEAVLADEEPGPIRTDDSPEGLVGGEVTTEPPARKSRRRG